SLGWLYGRPRIGFCVTTPEDQGDDLPELVPDSVARAAAEGMPDTFPELVNPVLVGAFEGWNDAGDAASGAIEHLQLVWDAVPLAELDPDEYYDFQVNRPSVSQVDG